MIAFEIVVKVPWIEVKDQEARIIQEGPEAKPLMCTRDVRQ